MGRPLRGHHGGLHPPTRVENLRVVSADRPFRSNCRADALLPISSSDITLSSSVLAQRPRQVPWHAMDLTDALAVFGAATGSAGLVWQLWSHRLTGGRVELTSTLHRTNEGWEIRTHAANIGRLDVTVQVYVVWFSVRGHYGYRLREWARLRLRFGLTRTRRLLLVHNPSVILGGRYVAFGTGNLRVELPAVLKAGTLMHFPPVHATCPQDAKRLPRVAIRLGTGQFVNARLQRQDDLRVRRPIGLHSEDYDGYSITVQAVSGQEQESVEVPRLRRWLFGHRRT
jgi:hypothetical protein